MQKTKLPKDEVDDKLHDILIGEIGEEYRVLWENDDGGLHIAIAFEEFCPPLAKKLFSGQFMGWRLVKKICPKGYLEVFYPLSKDE